MSRNIDLGVELRKKDDEIEKLKKSCQDAQSLAKGRAKEMHNLKDALLVCMKEAKVLIDGDFTKREWN